MFYDNQMEYYKSYLTELEKENKRKEVDLQLQIYTDIKALDEKISNIQTQLEELGLWIKNKFEENQRSAQNDCGSL